MLFENNIIKANTIEDAWRDAMWCCVRNGYDYKIEHGSYVGQIRRQLPYLIIIIDKPGTRPFNFHVPDHLNFVPTTEEAINEYFMQYIVGTEKAENEDYTYSEYINQQLDRTIEILNESHGNSNQASIFVGEPSLIYKDDPPCLRNISFKVVNGKLNMTVYFRSWDIVAALPQNLGGLQLLKEYILAFLEFPVEDGQLICYSSGAHLYEQYFPLVNELCVDKIII